MSTIRRLYVSVRADNSHAVRGLREVGDEADRAEGTLGTLDGRTQMLETSFMALGAATAAVGYGLMRITQAGMQVDQTLRMVKATSGATAQEMSMIRSEVQELGRELPVATSDAANAFKELSYAGFDARQSVAAVGGVAELASASTLSVAQSAEITANALNQFSMEAEQAGAVADTAAGTFASSSMTMQEYAEAMNYAGNAAATAGFNITETSAALGVMADAGLKGSRAGTALQASLSGLADPSSDAQEALESVGMSVSDFTDEEGNFKSMAEIASILNENLEGLPDSKKLEVLTSVFGERGARGMAALAENSDKLQEKLMAVSASQVAGAMDEITELDNSALKERNQELQALANQQGGPSVQFTADMNRRQMLKEFQAASSELSQDELSQQIEVGLNVDEEAADRLASELGSGTDVGVIADELERAKTTGGLTAAQMDTLGGKLEYIRGTLESIGYSAFRGMKPVLMGAADAGMFLVDALSANKTVAKAAGVAALGLFAALTTLTVVVGSLVAAEYAYQASLIARTGAQRVSTAATWAYNAATNAAALSTLRARAATVASTAAHYASASAKYAAAGASYVLSGGLYTAAAGAWAMLAPFWPILAVVGALVGLWAAWNSNLFGFRDAVSGATSMFMNFLSPVERFHSLLNMLTSFSVSDIPLIGGALSMGLNAGKNLAQGMSQGTKQNKGLVGQATGALAGAADAFLPSSPADKGPLSTLDKVGPGLANTVAQGIRGNQGPVASAAQSLAGTVQGALPAPLAGVVSQVTGQQQGQGQQDSGQSQVSVNQQGGGGTSITVQQEVNFNGGSPDANIRDQMREARNDLIGDLSDMIDPNSQGQGM